MQPVRTNLLANHIQLLHTPYMKMLAIVAVLIVSVLHFGFLALEMFYWDHPIGRDIFSMSPEESKLTATLASNQGLYNGFLAAGLIWGAAMQKKDVIIFFLLCVIVAGVFGAITAKPTIFFTQALPAIIALLLTFATKFQRRYGELLDR